MVVLYTSLWDRPFNMQGVGWGGGGGGNVFFVWFRIFFSDNTRVRIFIFFVAQSANLTLGYMTKTLNQIISPPPLFQVKWSVPNDIINIS